MGINKLITGLVCFATTMAFISGFILTSQFDVEKYNISGKVTFDDQVPKLRPLNMNADPKCLEINKQAVPNPMLSVGANNGLANIFVSISNPPKGDYSIPTEPIIFEFKDCLCTPRVAAAMVGQEVKFLNSDGILHNVHGLPKANREFNIGMPPTLKEKSITLNTVEEMFRIRSDIHPWERAYLTIVDHPFHAITSSDGTFEIPELPNGTYELIAWHERLPAMKGTVTISGEDASIDFSFKTPKRE